MLKVVFFIKIRREKNPGNIGITLYQIVTCPFCCKVRAYLDYFGYSYDIVEVNSLTKHQLDWSSYKKSPIVVIQVPSKDNPNEYDQVVEVNCT
jgi:microsomal prostaglandin-E synthase 2